MLNRFWVKMNLKNADELTQLLQAFFQDFNPENSIVIKGNEARLQIFFDDPPMEIIKAIRPEDLGNFEFHFGKDVGEYEEEPTEAEVNYDDKSGGLSQDEDVPPPNKQKVDEAFSGEPGSHSKDDDESIIANQQPEKEAETDTAAKNAVPAEPVSTEDGVSSKKKSPGRKHKKEIAPKDKPKDGRNVKLTTSEVLGIIPMMQMAKEAKSFEEFSKALCKWLEVSDRQKEVFEAVFLASSQIEADELSWPTLQKRIQENGVFFTTSNKIFFTQFISKKFKEHFITALPFLAAVKEVSLLFKILNGTSIEPKQVSEEPEQVSVTEKSSTVSTVKMKCLPEVPELEVALGSINKESQTLEQRAEIVLKAMGWEKITRPSEKRQIFEFLITAIRQDVIDFDLIGDSMKLSQQACVDVRMKFSKFLTDFVHSYDKNCKVKVLDFIRELKEIIA